MMNSATRLLTLLVACLSLLGAFAQTTYRLGYCPDEISDQVQTAVLNVSYDCLFSAGIVIPESRMKLLKGGTIRKVRLATEEGLSMIHVMLRHELDGPSIEGTYTDVPGTTERGWKEVDLTMPYIITGDQLVIMYTGYLPAGKGLLCEGNPHPEGFYSKSNGIDWMVGSQYGYGPLCLQAEVEVNGEIVTEDLALASFHHAGAYYPIGEFAPMTFTLSNFGMSEAALPAVHYSWVVEGQADNPQVVETQGKVAAGETVTCTFDLPTTACHEGVNEVKLWIDSHNGVTVNDTLRTTLVAYQESYPRQTLIEHFSTLVCPNCPPVHGFINKELIKKKPEMVWVIHHVGFGTDELTVNDSEELRLLLNVTASPRLTYDRRVVTNSLDENNPIIPGTTVYSSEADFQFCTKQPAFVKLDLETQLQTDTRQCVLTVRGERTNLCSQLFPEARLTVQFVEDSVTTLRPQLGSGEKIHNHVYRQSLTSILGDEITWEGNTFTRTFAIDLPAHWNLEHLKAVAFVNSPTDQGGQKLEILNASQVAVHQQQTGITAGTNVGMNVISRTYYNLQGLRIERPATGVYLEKVVTAQGTTVQKHVK